MKKGFLFSLDALIALALLFSVILVSFFYFGNAVNAQDYSILKKTANDVPAVLEKTGLLKNAIDQNNLVDINSFFNSLPKNLCIKTSIFPENDLQNPILELARESCSEDFSGSALSNRTIITENGFTPSVFLARTIAWFKGEST